MATQRLAEWIIVSKGDNWFREIVEVASQYIGGIMHCVARPVKALPVPWRSVECSLQLLDPLFRAG
jgi:hypothetical protein